MDLKKYKTLETKVLEFISQNEMCYLLFFNGSELTKDTQELLKEYLLLINNGEEPNVWFVDREKLYEEITKLLGRNGNFIIQYSKTMQIDIIHINNSFITRYSNNIEEITKTLENKLARKDNQVIHSLRINKKELEFLIKQDYISNENKTLYKEKLQQVKSILFSFGVSS